MGYSGTNTTRPRSALVILGGMMAWFGLWAGTFIAAPSLHDSMTMGDEPVEMTWQALVDEGLTTTNHIRLVDVEIHEIEPESEPEDSKPEDSELEDSKPEDGELEDGELEENDPFDVPRFSELRSDIDFPDIEALTAVVVSAGQDVDATPAHIIVPPNFSALARAFSEVDTSGTLTGVFRRQAVTSDEGDLEYQYVFSVYHGLLTQKDATTWFVLSYLGVTLGLVICGAGGPSVACFFFFQAPSFLSLFGYPLRYGRGQNVTRVLYAFVGLSLIAYGYEMMFVHGGFGTVMGDPGAIAIGFLQLSIGSAALLGGTVNFLAERFHVSLEPASKKKARPRLTYDQACGMTPRDAIETRRYADRPFSTVGSSAVVPDHQELADQFTELGFSQPLSFSEKGKGAGGPLTLQLGCQDMVVVMIEGTEDTVRVRMASVLQDGLVILTLDSNTPRVSSRRFGSSGLYTLAKTNDPSTMLSNQLEQTVTLAENRDTTVIALERNEMLAMAGLAGRVLADVKTQYGEAHFEITPARYGRLAFPPQPVPCEAALV